MPYFKLVTVILIAIAKNSASLECSGQIKEKCFCGKTKFENQLRYVVNCTNAGFTSTTPLQELPSEIEVLIFTGNQITQLPWNVFGTLQNYSNLHVVDMSNNDIQEIKGKAYHHVPNVHRLILNHNRISITDDYHHPRIFSNFVNLEELHLTNAFEDNAGNLATDLHDIFISSNLTKLIKLHLEQNEVSTFQDKGVFCDLPKLLDLHLGDNKVTGIDFDIGCLHNLRYIDLEGNSISSLSESQLQKMDDLPKRNQSLTVNLNYNPFLCNCGNERIFRWFSETPVTIRDRANLQCDRSQRQSANNSRCHASKTSDSSGPPHNNSTTAVMLAFMFSLLTVAILLLLYYKDRIRQKVIPMVSSVSRQVHYSTIVNNEEQEVAV